MKSPRYTPDDLARQPKGGYVTAKDTQEPGYLAAKFKAIAEAQAKDAAEVAEKLRPMKRAAK